MIGGIISLSLVGFVGRLVLIIGHGLCSSGLFCIANLYYNRVGSQRILLNKDIITVLPIGALI